MKQKIIPGFRALFGEPQQTYESIMREMPSYTAISLAVTLINELSAPVEYVENQHRIWNIIMRGYTQPQKDLLSFQLTRLMQNGYGNDAIELFHRRYLLALIIKELKRNVISPPYIPANGKEFSFLLAYFLIIDEEHAKDRPLLGESLKKQSEPFLDYRLIWTSNISQFQFNESVSPLFELFKLLAFFRYALITWRPNLKEYLNGFNFTSIGQIAKSYTEIFNATQHYNPHELLSKLVHIKPNSDADAVHLRSLCINGQFGNKNASLLHLKKQPLLLTEDSRFRIIDADLFFKHIYRGPFFDLLKTTSLTNNIKFNKYSSLVSKNVLEENCFTGILQSLGRNSEHLYFDDGTASIPDCYYRENFTIFLIEFKAYILKDEITEKPDFDNIKNYIDENFIKKSDGSPKGVGQLINQIENIRANKYLFDKELSNNRDKNKYTIYPIISHNDFHFSLTGINEYVNQYFLQEVSAESRDLFDIRNATFVNLSWIFDIALRHGSFTILANFIDQYWVKLADKKDSFAKEFDTDVFLSSKSSFAEIYQNEFIHSLPSVREANNNFTVMMEHLGIGQELLDELV